MPRITISAPLEPRPAPAAAAKTSRGAVSLIKAADSRILQLEGDVRRREGELEVLNGQLAQAQVGAAPTCRRWVVVERRGMGLALLHSRPAWMPPASCSYASCLPTGADASPQNALARRDAEIARLSAQLAQGPDVEALAQRYRNDANEAVILQLNQQVRGWGVQRCQRWMAQGCLPSWSSKATPAVLLSPPHTASVTLPSHRRSRPLLPS